MTFWYLWQYVQGSVIWISLNVHIISSVILQLIDVDEDGCLSVGEVFKMIYVIEKNFVLELNHFTIMNLKSFRDTALRNSFQKFKIIMSYRKSPLEQIDQRFLNQSLITFGEFMDIFENNPSFLKVFLPKNIDMPVFVVLYA
jgi:hypothetical protein